MSALVLKGRSAREASGQAGRFAMTLTALKRPAPRASKIPRLTPGDSAKSSAQRQNEKDASAVPMMINRSRDREDVRHFCEKLRLQALAHGENKAWTWFTNSFWRGRFGYEFPD